MIGILAYGSLINDPGSKIKSLIVQRIQTVTPFPVEYCQLSGKTRGGAPTVAPHHSGNPVKAEVLVLSDSVSLDEATDLLWRRETRQEGSGKKYEKKQSPNAVIIRDNQGFCGLEHVLYTDFNSDGKIADPTPILLAKAAVDSVKGAELGKDGINYLIELKDSGVVTSLTEKYSNEILQLTGTKTLSDALNAVKRGIIKNG